MPQTLSASAASPATVSAAAAAAFVGTYPGATTYPGAAVYPGRGTNPGAQAASPQALTATPA